MAVLSASEIISIEQKAKDVLTSVYGDNEITPPIDLAKIAEEYKFIIQKGDFKDTNIAGSYNKKDKTISVSKEDIYQRQIFTIAHELGHFFLHNDKENEEFYRTQITQLDTEKRKEEAEANWFAASLLMPEDLVKKYWKFTKDIDAIAKIFGVSNSAVYFRLKYLGLMH